MCVGGFFTVHEGIRRTHGGGYQDETSHGMAVRWSSPLRLGLHAEQIYSACLLSSLLAEDASASPLLSSQRAWAPREKYACDVVRWGMYSVFQLADYSSCLLVVTLLSRPNRPENASPVSS